MFRPKSTKIAESKMTPDVVAMRKKVATLYNPGVRNFHGQSEEYKAAAKEFNKMCDATGAPELKKMVA